MRPDSMRMHMVGALVAFVSPVLACGACGGGGAGASPDAAPDVVVGDPHDALAASWRCLEGASQPGGASGPVDVAPLDRWMSATSRRRRRRTRRS